MRNWTISQAPPVAPRREPRPPKRPSPSEAATSAYAQMREKFDLGSHTLEEAFVNGIRAPPKLGGAPR